MNPRKKPAIESESEGEWALLSTQVQAVMIGLVDENRQLRLRIAKLEEQLRRNSGNSSQPPSQDKAEQKPVQEEGGRSARRRGGQPGDVGCGRTLLPVEAVDLVVVHRPAACQTCGAVLLGCESTLQRHQITELPRVKATVTEHQVHSVICVCCGATNRGHYRRKWPLASSGRTW